MIKLIFFRTDTLYPVLPVLEKISKIFTNNELYEIIKIDESNIHEVNNIDGSAIIFFQISDKNSLTYSLTILKNNIHQIKNGIVKTACFLKIDNKKIDNKKIERTLSKLGCREFINENIAERSLEFKINFWTKSLINQIKDAHNTEDKVHNKEIKQKNIDTSSNAFSDFELTEPLNIQEDIWLNSATKLCKKVLRSIIIRLVGPCQGAVYWKEENISENGDQIYRLVYATENVKEQILGSQYSEGEWFFNGSKPDYDWDQDEWVFTGLIPKLYFKTKSNIYSRINIVKNAECSISSNSLYSNRKLPVYFELKKNSHTFGNELREEQNKKNFEGEKKKESSRLTGKSSTDNFGAGYLKGKSQTEELGNGNLEGKSYTEELGNGNLEGKSYTDDLGSGYFEGKNKTDDLGGQLKGNGRTSKINDSLKGNAGTDHVDRSHYRNKEKTAGKNDPDSEGDNLGRLKFSEYKKKKDSDIKNNAKIKSSDENESFSTITETPNIHLGISFKSNNVIRTTEGILVEWTQQEFSLISQEFNIEDASVITIMVDIKYNSKNYKFKLLGKITEVTPNDDGRATYNIALDGKYEDEHFKFTEIYAQRQTHINTFMRLAKGQ